MNDLMTKSFLSYVDLKKQALKGIEVGSIDVEMGQLALPEEENLTQFFEEVGVIKSEMESITSLLVDLQDLNEESKSIHSSKVLRGLRDRMDSDMVTVLRKAKIIKARLESLDQSNVANRSTYREGSTIDRTRMSVTNGLRIKLRDMMNDFQGLRNRIVTDHKEGLKRRYFNAYGRVLSDEEVEKMVLKGGQVEVFAGNHELDLENKEREEAVKGIQRSLTELHQVFLDMAVLVDAQGEQMDDIELNMAQARMYISGGTDRLVSAKAMKKRGAERLVCLVWGFVLLLILIGIVSTLSH